MTLFLDSTCLRGWIFFQEIFTVQFWFIILNISFLELTIISLWKIFFIRYLSMSHSKNRSAQNTMEKKAKQLWEKIVARYFNITAETANLNLLNTYWTVKLTMYLIKHQAFADSLRFVATFSAPVMKNERIKGRGSALLVEYLIIYNCFTELKIASRRGQCKQPIREFARLSPHLLTAATDGLSVYLHLLLSVRSLPIRILKNTVNGRKKLWSCSHLFLALLPMEFNTHHFALHTQLAAPAPK